MAIYAITVKLLLSAAQFMGAFGAEGIFLTHTVAKLKPLSKLASVLCRLDQSARGYLAQMTSPEELLGLGFTLRISPHCLWMRWIGARSWRWSPK